VNSIHHKALLYAVYPVPLTLPHTLLHPHYKHTQSKIFSPRYQFPQPNTKTGKEGKCKVPVQSNKAYRGSREIHPLIINLGTRWRSSVKCTAGLLHARSKPPLLLRGRLHVPSSRFGHFRDEKDLILLAGNKPTDRPASTALPQLRTAAKAEVMLHSNLYTSTYCM